ncbi:transposase [Cohnella sp. CBP 2801]|uniref:Transposase n=1 Tax=Cohnella zeiphila TaxID=2761120 RepID=A0A7X0SQ09_9BACL|nr:transposase [Cohnella zeiphila]
MTAQDTQNALKDLFAETLQEMLEAEMDTYLGYEKHGAKNKQTTNSRNGKSRKTHQRTASRRSPFLQDREGAFEPLVVKKHQSNVTALKIFRIF